MRLAKRMSAYVAAVMCLLSVILLVAAAGSLLTTAGDTDERSALEASRRAQTALGAQLAAMSGNAVDWSMWDATYQFMDGKNPEYVGVNLPNGTFENLAVDVIGFYDPTGKPRLVVAVDAESGETTSIAGIGELLSSNPELNLPSTGRDSFSGVLALPGGRMLLTAAGTVTSSDRSAKPNGTLVMGRILDAGVVNAVARDTQLDLTMSPVSSKSGSVRPTVGIVPGTIEVTEPILDPAGRPLAQTHVKLPRQAWQSALRSLLYLGLSIVALLALTMMLINRGIHRIVLTRLGYLDESVSRIRHTGKPESLVVAGNDELSSLAGNVTALVAELDQSHSLVDQARQRYETLLDNLSDVVFTMEPDGTLDFVSSAVLGMFGVRADEVTGRGIETLLGPQAADQVRRRIKRGLSDEGARLTIDGCASNDGPLDLDVILMLTRADSTIQGILRDATARRRHESELLHMASHDFLTGLWNRRRFEDELGRALCEVERGADPGAVLWLDLDRFKDVNDSLGHKAGDELLSKVAQKLSTSVRSDSFVARLGGDEFAVLMPSTDKASACAAAERLLEAVAEARLDVEGRLVRASASLGVVLYPEHGTDVEELLARADMAMYRAKELGRSGFRVFDPAEAWQDSIEDRRVWTDMVEMALAEGGLVAHAQPILDLNTGEIVSYELLVRMVSFDGEIIMPDRFLPTAERTGIIVDIDIWILGQAVDILKNNPDSSFRLNVNASPRTLSDPRYLVALDELVTSSLLEPSRLTIEITETAIIVDVANITDTLRRIKELGCRVALDDFGSGFTSFLHLKQLPIDDIKIDGSFMRNVDDCQSDQHLVRAMVEMAKGLDMQTTAEFVESAASMDMLRSMGVEMAQGYAIGRPSLSADVDWSGEFVDATFRRLA